MKNWIQLSLLMFALTSCNLFGFQNGGCQEKLAILTLLDSTAQRISFSDQISRGWDKFGEIYFLAVEILEGLNQPTITKQEPTWFRNAHFKLDLSNLKKETQLFDTIIFQKSPVVQWNLVVTPNGRALVVPLDGLTEQEQARLLSVLRFAYKLSLQIKREMPKSDEEAIKIAWNLTISPLMEFRRAVEETKALLKSADYADKDVLHLVTRPYLTSALHAHKLSVFFSQPPKIPKKLSQMPAALLETLKNTLPGRPFCLERAQNASENIRFFLGTAVQAFMEASEKLKLDLPQELPTASQIWGPNWDSNAERLFGKQFEEIREEIENYE